MEAKRLKQFKKMFDCDTARIVKPCSTFFLIIGWNRNTKDSKGVYWEKNGKRIDFDYVEEKCIASGRTMKELEASAREYKRLCGMTMLDYLREKGIAV